jgi:hypothetical protein
VARACVCAESHLYMAGFRNYELELHNYTSTNVFSALLPVHAQGENTCAMEGTQRTRDGLLGKSDVDPISGSESMSLTKHAPGGQELNSFKIVKSAL